jgi:hypothetical protein
MSRAGHVVAPAAAATSRNGPAPRAASSRGGRRKARGEVCDYIERAMLLWPRLDRTKLRRCGDDPNRIASFVVRRTAQPLDAVLAMLARQLPAPTPITELASGFEAGDRPARVGLHVVRETEAVDISEFVLAFGPS